MRATQPGGVPAGEIPNLLEPGGRIGREVDRRLPIVPQIHDALRDAIIRVAVLPGQAISETELAASFGVSRTPIREALIRLADEGLIDIYPQAGTFVSRIDLAAVREAQFVRQTLETAVAIQAASTSAGVTVFEPILERQARAIRDGDFGEFFASDEDLHRKVFEVAGHGATWRLVQAAKSHLDRVRQLERPAEVTLLEMRRQHRAIAAAIVAGDPDAAAEVVREHATVILAIAPDVAARHPDLFRG
ncbi:MAG: GntR family transcriptional regulator [Chloroflexi bacterium]|nr:GntR family transcriptional regulator [Chloroflexota bacterium]